MSQHETIDARLERLIQERVERRVNAIFEAIQNDVVEAAMSKFKFRLVEEIRKQRPEVVGTAQAAVKIAHGVGEIMITIDSTAWDGSK